MARNHDTDLLSTIFPDATRALLSALQHTQAHYSRADHVDHESVAYHRQSFIDPVLDALGYDEPNRREHPASSAQVDLMAKQGLLSRLICLPPGDLPHGTAKIAERHRTEPTTVGRIIFTNGFH